MYAIFTILYRGSDYDFAWISSTQGGETIAADAITIATAEASGASDHDACCLVGTTQLDHERRVHLQQQILTAAQLLSFADDQSTVRATGAGAARSLARTAAQEPNKLFRRIGTLLFTQLVPAAIQQQLQRLPVGTTLQLVTDDVNWPWELLHDGDDFLALKFNVTRLPCLDKRALQRSNNEQRRARTTKATCLLLGNPTSDLPGTIEEITAIEDLLFVARERVTYRSLFGDHISADYLQDQFATDHYDLIHYAGHATVDGLTLAKAPFRVDSLRHALLHQPTIVLNACATAQAATTPVDLATLSRNAQSLASALIGAGAGAVIGMLWPIPDRMAMRFGQILYQHLTAGESIGSALRATRIVLRREEPEGIAWLAPVLYGNAWQQPFPTALKATVATILAIRFPAPPVDLRAGKEPTGDERAHYLTLLAQRLGQYGGTIFSVTESTLLATFGLYKPNDHNALTAIFAARDLAAQVATWKVAQPAIAIVSGELAVGSVTPLTSSISQPTALLLLGNAVQIAEQLMTLAAPGQILINELVHDRSKNHFHAQPWQHDTQHKVQGALPLCAFTLVSTPLPTTTGSLALDFSVTIGRKAEQTQLMMAWQAVQQGQGQVIGISGEAGIGKTHLVQTLRRQIGQHELCWRQVGCTIDMQHSSYALLARLLRSLLDLPFDLPSMQLESLLSSHFPDRAAAELTLLADLLGMQGQHTQRQERSVYQHQLARLLTQLLRHYSAQQPLILIVEDAHWSDTASLDVLTLVANQLDEIKLLLCLVHRSEWQPPWVGKAYYQSIQLRPLGRLERQQLYKELLDTTQLPDELITLVDRASGNPLFLTEILVTLLHKRLLVPLAESDKAWQTTGILHARDLPDSVQRIIDLRLEQLAESSWEVLAMGAVLGVSFAPTMLGRSLARSDEELYAQLTMLTEQDLLRSSLEGDEYAFRHELIRDVVYMNIPLPQRQLWHRQIADALETPDTHQREANQQAAEQREVVALLAHHYYYSLIDGNTADEGPLNRASDAKVVEKALAYLVQSGEDALARYGAHEAVTLFKRAATVADLLPEDHLYQSRIYAGLGDAYRLISAHGAAKQAYRKAQGLLHMHPLTLETRAQAARLARLLARLHMWQAEYTAADAWIATGLECVSGYVVNSCQAAAALLYIQAASICFNRGEYKQAIVQCNTGLAIVQQHADKEAAAEGNFILGTLMYATGDYGGSLAYYSTSLALYQQQQNLYQIHRVRMNIGLSLFYQSEWSAALAHYKEVLIFWEEIGEENLQAGICINVGLAEKYLGNWPAAHAYYQRALTICNKLGNQKWAALTHSNLGALYSAQESWPAARSHLTASLEILKTNAIKDFQAGALAHLALIELAEGALELAFALATQAVILAQQNNEQVDHAIALRVLGQVLAAQGDRHDAAAHLLSSQMILETVGNRYELARTFYQQALLKEASAEYSAAQQSCTAAIVIFQELSAQKDLESANQLYTRLLADS